VPELDGHVAVVLGLVVLDQVKHRLPVAPGNKRSGGGAAVALVLADGLVPKEVDEPVTPAAIDGRGGITGEEEGRCLCCCTIHEGCCHGKQGSRKEREWGELHVVLVLLVALECSPV
jgi:hypothetical protein